MKHTVAFIAFTMGWAIAMLGAVGMMAPSVLVGVIALLRSPVGLYVAAGLRVVLGAALFVAAPTSRAPRLFRVLGAVTIVAGLLLPFLGVERFESLLGWWSAQGSAVLRLWAALALSFGLLVAYGIIPKQAR